MHKNPPVHNLPTPDEDRIMKFATSIASSVLSLAIAGSALAETPVPPAAPASTASSAAKVDFSTIDENKDGRLSKMEAEVNNDLKSSFATLDSNRDGYLSTAEFSKWNEAGKSTTSLSSGAKDSAGSAGEEPSK
jgi:hypothetical protein